MQVNRWASLPMVTSKTPTIRKRWIVDDEAAQVVRRIYSITLEGYGTAQIATQLERDEILTPRAY